MKSRCTCTATTPQSRDRLALDKATGYQRVLFKALTRLSAISSNRSILESQTVDSFPLPPAWSPVNTREPRESLPHDSFGNKSLRAGELMPAVERKNRGDGVGAGG